MMTQLVIMTSMYASRVQLELQNEWGSVKAGFTSTIFQRSSRYLLQKRVLCTLTAPKKTTLVLAVSVSNVASLTLLEMQAAPASFNPC
jgi:hypothetical protein